MNALANTSRSEPLTRRRAFTLIELLVVVGVIVLLSAITLVVGPSVINSRKASSTEQIVTGLDGMLETYIQERGGAIPPNPGPLFLSVWQAIPTSGGNANASDLEQARARYGDANNLENVDTDIIPITANDEFIRPSSAMFVEQARGVAGVDDALGNLPPSRLAQIFSPGASSDPVTITAILDAWGDASRPFERHILYVHPSNERAQQLYGYCQNGRPYFLSAGADGVYGSVHDLSRSLREQADRGEGPFRTVDDRKRFFDRAREDNITSYEVRLPPIAPGAELQLNPEQ